MATPLSSSTASSIPTHPSFGALPIETHRQIATLDFRTVKNFLREKKGWQDLRIAETERLYRRFLEVLAAMDPVVVPVPPTEDIKCFWLAHRTREHGDYYNTCVRIIGRYVHPRRFFLFGARRGKDTVGKIWMALFGEEPPQDHLSLI